MAYIIETGEQFINRHGPESKHVVASGFTRGTHSIIRAGGRIKEFATREEAEQVISRFCPSFDLIIKETD